MKSYAAAEIAVSGNFVYASVRDFSKAPSDTDHNGLAVFSFAPTTGKLNWVEFFRTGGVSPRGFVIDRSGSMLFAANELSETLATFKVNPESGRLTRTGDLLPLGGKAIGIALVTSKD